MARSQAILHFILFALVLPGSILAQTEEPAELVTDRPDQTESAVVVPAGTFQAELGVGYLRDEEPRVDVELFEAPGTLLRWGLSRRLELRLAWPGWIELEERSPDGRSRRSGVGDPELGAKVSFLAAQRGDTFDLALLAHLSLPAGDAELRAPRADPSVRLNGAHALGERLGLGWNIGYETASFEDARGEVHTLGRFLYTAALGIDLSVRWALFVEVYGDLPASDPARPAHSFDAGVTFLVTPRVQIDLYGGAGLNDAAPDWIAGAGLSFRIPR